jgi:hypothetical protein
MHTMKVITYHVGGDADGIRRKIFFQVFAFFRMVKVKYEASF